MSHVSESDESVELNRLSLKLCAEILFFPHLFPTSRQLASVWTCGLSCTTCYSSYYKCLCTELPCFPCIQHLTWSCTPKSAFPPRLVWKGGVHKAEEAWKFNLLRKWYSRCQRCTHSGALDHHSAMKNGLKYTLDYIVMSFFLLKLALNCGAQVQSWVWAPESRVLPGQPNSQQKADGRETKCVCFFHLNLFIPLSKHKSIVCRPLMDYVKGGLCPQHLLTDLTSSCLLW